jgi:hypothetical protein
MDYPVEARSSSQDHGPIFPVSSDLVHVSLELAQSGRVSHLIWISLDADEGLMPKGAVLLSSMRWGVSGVVPFRVAKTLSCCLPHHVDQGEPM